MSWVSVSKPNSTSWTRVNPQGKQEYDQFDITYDNPNVFYDSTNEGAWTSVQSGITPSWVSVAKPT